MIRELDRKPAVIGHSFGGLLTQILAGRGCNAVSVAIDPAPFRGVLPLPISALRSGSPVLKNPANKHKAIPLTFEQFHYAFGNALSEDEAKALYEKYAVPGSGVPIFHAAAANLNPWTEVKVDTKNPSEDRSSSSRASSTTPSRRRSRTRRTSVRRRTPASPSSSRSRGAATLS